MSNFGLYFFSYMLGNLLGLVLWVLLFERGRPVKFEIDPQTSAAIRALLALQPPAPKLPDPQLAGASSWAMGAFEDLHATVAAHPLFAETWGYTSVDDLDASAVNTSVRVRREAEAAFTGPNGRFRAWTFELVVPRADMASPKPGDLWSGELVRGGGSPVTFEAGLPRAGDGHWIIPVRYSDEREDAGGVDIEEEVG